jgi:hypothetical protein
MYLAALVLVFCVVLGAAQDDSSTPNIEEQSTPAQEIPTPAPPAEAPKRPAPRPTYRPDEKELSKIPDLTKNDKPLKCSSCRAVAREVHERLWRVSKLRHGHPKHVELVDVLDPVCAQMGASYGLLLKNNEPTTEFSRNEKISRYQGAWINTYLERRCGEIMDHYDDDLIREALRHESLDAFRDRLCTKLEKTCQTRAEAVVEDL